MVVAMATLKDFSVLNFVVVPQPKSMRRFSPNMDMFNSIGSKVALVLWEYPTIVLRFFSEFVSVPYPEPMHEFSPYFQSMLNSTGSRQA